MLKLYFSPSTSSLATHIALIEAGAPHELIPRLLSKQQTRTPEHLAWRTSFGPLRYRVLLASPSDPAEGGVVFRLRRRGDTVEAAIIEQLVPDYRTGARLVARVLRETGADYAIGLRTGPSAGLVPLPVPGAGPLLTSRPLAASPPPASAWCLTLGDIELF